MESKLAKRITSGLIAVLAVAVIGLWMPSVGGCILLGAISTLALLEFYHLLGMMGIPSFKGVGTVFGILIIAGTWASLALQRGTQWEPVLLTAFVIVVFVRQFPQKHNDQPLATIACTVLGVLYAPFLLNYFAKLVFTWEPPGMLGLMGTTGRLLLFYVVAVVKVTDIGAYVIGSQWGRHKLIPRISPAKTWEGCIGGIGSGLITSLVFFWLCGGQFGRIAMSGLDALVLGVLLPVLGTVGDLSESMLKRAAGVKDSSGMVPGMGGVLDVLDSLLFAVPALYLYTEYVL